MEEYGRIELTSTSRFTLQVIRANQGTYVKGRYQEAEGSSFLILANIQPLSPDELNNFPEAQRTKEMLKLYTPASLLTAEESPLRRADIVLYNQKQYQVQQVYRYRGQHQRHHKAICVRVDAGSQRN